MPFHFSPSPCTTHHFWALLGSALLCASVAQSADGAPDLSGTVPILEERFDGVLDRFDGKRGVWSTLPRRGKLLTNAAQTVFFDTGVIPPADEKGMLPVHEVTREGLSLRTVRLTDRARTAVREVMRNTGQGARAEDILYVTGQINTSRTWSQVYGWFEIEARVPRGQGRWPAFWLTFAGEGWPPEIDVMEAFGAGIASPTRADGTFNAAVLFDAYDDAGQKVHAVDILNPFDDDPSSRSPSVKQRFNRDIYTLIRRVQIPGDEIYDRVNTYAALWTPDEIIFYYGRDRASLREVYRTPTPDDVHVPMYLIANDQFTANGGWWPADPALEKVLDPANDFLIRSITLRAFEPGLVLDMKKGAKTDDARASIVLDTPGDDTVALGDGFDIVRLSGGDDEVRVERGHYNKIIEGFGPGDRLALSGFPFADSEALDRLTQVGADLWLTAPADPFWPQTVILRDTNKTDISAGQIVAR